MSDFVPCPLCETGEAAYYISVLDYDEEPRDDRLWERDEFGDHSSKLVCWPCHELKVKELGYCKQCQTMRVSGEHECPYNIEMGGMSSLCNCCSHCMGNNCSGENI